METLTRNELGVIARALTARSRHLSEMQDAYESEGNHELARTTELERELSNALASRALAILYPRAAA